MRHRHRSGQGIRTLTISDAKEVFQIEHFSALSEYKGH